MKNWKKILVFACLLSVVAFIVIAAPTKSRTKNYFSGDAINYNGKLYVASVNTGSFELFALENSSLYKKTTVKSNDNPGKEFLDVKLVRESGRLYAFLVNGRWLYKYDITNPEVPVAVKKIKDNSWDWFVKVDVSGDKLITVGSKGMKIWNKEFQVIDSHSAINEKTIGSLDISAGGNFVLSSRENKVAVYSIASRDKAMETSLKSDDKYARRAVFNDSASSIVYVADDESLKAFDFSGKLLNQFRHISDVGYDVAEAADTNYLYFSDGLGVVKVRKSDMKPVNWVYSYRLGVPGSWSMGLKAVNFSGSDKIVIFNGSNIMVLNNSLEKVAYYVANEQDNTPMEEVYLRTDKNMGAPNTQVMVSGGGFGLKEAVEIKFGQTVFKTQTNEDGRFSEIVNVPVMSKGVTDIKAIGKDSKRTFSITFKVE